MPKNSFPKPRIFISHSAHGADEAILDTLEKSLSPKFNVFVDKQRLIAGQKWRDELFTAMQRSHGAIILFNTPALKSEWVRTEASILASQQTLDQTNSFPLIPVLLNPVTRKDLEAKEFAPMRLSTLQLVRAKTPAAIVKQVQAGLKHLLQPFLPETPLEKLARSLALILRPLEERDLLNAAIAMKLDVSGWANGSEYPVLLANELLEQGLSSKTMAALRRIDDFLGPDATGKVIEMIAPAWVNRHAASLISQIATKAAARKLWVNGGEYPEFTARHFVMRACCRTPTSSWPVLPAVAFSSGENEVAHYKHVIELSIKTNVLKKEDASNLEIETVLDNRNKAREPVFVFFSPPGPPPEVIAQLSTIFPTLTFFSLIGAGDSLSLPVGVELLEPKLRIDEERLAHSNYLTARSYINQGARP